MIMSTPNVMNTLDCSLATLLQGSLRCWARHRSAGCKDCFVLACVV